LVAGDKIQVGQPPRDCPYRSAQILKTHIVLQKRGKIDVLRTFVTKLDSLRKTRLFIPTEL